MSQTGTLRGSHYRKLDGTQAEGTIKIELLVDKPTIRDEAGNVIWAGDLEVTLDGGAFVVQLPAGDGLATPAISPPVFSYRVTEQLKHVPKPKYRSVIVQVPTGGTLDLADVEGGVAATPVLAQPITQTQLETSLDDFVIDNIGDHQAAAAASQAAASASATSSAASASASAASAAEALVYRNQASAIALEDAETALVAGIEDPDSAVGSALSASFVPKWQPSTAYTAGDQRIVQGMVAERRTSGTSGASTDFTNWTTGTEPGNVPVVKPTGDGRAGVWEMTHNDTTGYLFHLLSGTSMGTSQALIALGVDNGGIGLLIPNKKTGRAIVLDQQAGITDAAAYGLQATQRSTLAPLMRLEQQASGTADLLQLLAFSGTSGRLLYVGDATGMAGEINQDGRIQWSRDVRAINKASGEVAVYFENSTSAGANSSNTRKAWRGAAADFFFGATGSAGIYYPYRHNHTGSSFTLDVAPNLTAASASNPTPSEVSSWSTVVGMRYASGAAQLAFFGATPSAKATISGSRGGNAALAALLTELAAKGLITDGTSA